MRFIVLLAVALYLEATIIQLPLVLILLIVHTAVSEKTWIFPVALVSGIILDNLMFRPLGSSSMFFLAILLLIFLYREKYEIKTPAFTAIVTMITSSVYLLIFGYSIFIFQILVSTFFSVMIFLGYIKYKLLWKNKTGQFG